MEPRIGVCLDSDSLNQISSENHYRLACMYAVEETRLVIGNVQQPEESSAVANLQAAGLAGQKGGSLTALFTGVGATSS